MTAKSKSVSSSLGEVVPQSHLGLAVEESDTRLLCIPVVAGDDSSTTPDYIGELQLLGPLTSAGQL